MANPPQGYKKPVSAKTQRLPGRSVHRVSSSLPQRHPHSRRATCGIAFIVTLLVGLVILGSVGLYAWNRYNAVAKSITIDLPDEQDAAGNVIKVPVATPNIVKEPFNMLLIGVDTREANLEEGARSDTLIVVHVDPQNGWASMLSIPRDSCVFIRGVTSGGECTRINEAYSFGYTNAAKGVEPDASGAALARDTVNQYLDLPARGQRINYVMQVDFHGFKEIIDTIGGINIDVKQPLFDPKYPSDDGDYGLIRLFVPPGYQHMDGTMALRYARSRHTTDDYLRSARQQQVIQAMLQALKERGLLDQIDALNDLGDKLHNTFRTDLPIGDISTVRVLADLAQDLAQGGRISNYTLGPFSRVIGSNPNPNIPDWFPEDIEQRVDEWLLGPTPVLSASGSNQPTLPALSAPNVEVVNAVGLGGLAGDVTNFLDAKGYATNVPSTASDIYDETVLVDFGSNKEVRERLARLLGLKPANVVTSADFAGVEVPDDPTTDLLLIIGRDYQEDWLLER